jgi:hypothetical protein
MAEIEFITLCDAAQSIGGKLFILGGAWSQLPRVVLQNPPDGTPANPPSQFAIAASIVIGWHEANETVAFEITVEDPDGKELMKAGGQFVSGRPPLPGPVPMRAAFAVPVSLSFPGPGTYCARAKVPGHERSASFSVHDVPGFVAPTPPTTLS